MLGIFIYTRIVTRFGPYKYSTSKVSFEFRAELNVTYFSSWSVRFNYQVNWKTLRNPSKPWGNYLKSVDHVAVALSFRVSRKSAPNLCAWRSNNEPKVQCSAKEKQKTRPDNNMMLMSSVNLERKCRICAVDLLDITCAIPIFSGIALEAKIRRYLYITVSCMLITPYCSSSLRTALRMRLLILFLTLDNDVVLALISTIWMCVCVCVCASTWMF